MKKINKILVANRGEIAIRVFRACKELGIRTVAVYSQEDILSLHRNRADEAYLVGVGKGAVGAYLDVEDIIRVAKEHHVDAIHPGYGFLAENADLAKRCEEEGIIFIGPRVEHLIMFGDKVNARIQAKRAEIPMIPGSDGPVSTYEEVKKFAETYGLPIMIKAVNGGGGRGMRQVDRMEDLESAFERAKSEAKMAFGDEEVYLEKCIMNPKHIEVQIIGDEQGNIIHLFERDCSIQRRHQKVIEMAPAWSLPKELRQNICDAAVKLMKNVNYLNAGTVEFLVDKNEKDFYFIEVNPRIQVEHTVTEMITDVDIVRTQILIAEGYPLDDAEVGIGKQEDIWFKGVALQCRITTEDPANNFMPDTGKLIAYRSGGGPGVRLDAGTAYTGAVITPHYDSLLVKVTVHALTPTSTVNKMLRCLDEFRISGVKTNIFFLQNALHTEDFQKGLCDVNYIDRHPELLVDPNIVGDRGTRLLDYIGDITINGYANAGHQDKPDFETPPVLDASHLKTPAGTRQLLEELGPEKFAKWIQEQNEVLVMDTTYRDAHQSLLATRLRTHDIMQAIHYTACHVPNMYAFENWGGATFDVAYRFLDESPWRRLREMRGEAPNILFQMLTRGANTVGYTNYPENVVRQFIGRAAANGIDVFRVFDCLNQLSHMEVTIDEVRKLNKLAEATICYTGDILDPNRQKYSLQYYANLAKDMEKAGANIIAIKDMAGLLKPEAATALVSTLKDAVDLPIHLHSHSGSGTMLYTYANAVNAGVDIIDLATTALSGGTSQPSLTAMYYALQNNPRQMSFNIHELEKIDRYWQAIRPYYAGVDARMTYPNTTVYEHEMPGGQYSNLRQQATAVGLGDRWLEVCDMYHQVNMMFGDIIKVTPSSKVVGDMALFMVQNNLTEDDIYDRGDTIDFPISVVDFFDGKLGVPYGGFPEVLQKIILRGREPNLDRKPVEIDINKMIVDMDRKEIPINENNISSYCIYPQVFENYIKRYKKFGDLSVLDTPTFFFGMKPGEEIRVMIEEGKMLLIRLENITRADENGDRIVQFELNGMPREIRVHDNHVEDSSIEIKKANPDIPGEIGATLSGKVVKLLVGKGDKVTKGDPIIVTEAMKMETTITAPIDGTVVEIHALAGNPIESGDLLLVIE
ncbi:pyruvate carboxylase [Dialister pneumosintes]|jgi:pyruvate carboxylase|uniref:Pyruvate carboxylase n=1 Tax=Dialister pneumosintes TaxID=39950 RepID=A0A1B3WC73_9FIRM|nr:pyruvate carboxylase [Dialister pneumosintes]AOH38563.1 pyruvate carboxylase [Dialister pneumosintes]